MTYAIFCKVHLNRKRENSQNIVHRDKVQKRIISLDNRIEQFDKIVEMMEVHKRHLINTFLIIAILLPLNIG